MVPSVDDCHWIVPVLPLTDAVIVPPLHIVEAEVRVTVPGTDGVVTVITDATAWVYILQTPFFARTKTL